LYLTLISSDFIEVKGVKYPIKDHMIGVCSHTMHLDPRNFPEPKKYNPDRFLDYGSPSFPRNAYRPFERGLRSCMGQSLAMEEMKIVLLLTARWFDFELMDHKPVEKPRLPQSDMDTIIGVHAYQASWIAAGPPESVKMMITSRH
jgi:cytochrome P450